MFDYAHPAFDLGAMAAQRRLPGIQGRSGTWFAGAWTGYGFHEDGLKSGLTVAAAIESRHDERLAVATHALRAAA
jgi:predicted NAD/FAD-binding protein